jgi:hypothetical protein
MCVTINTMCRKLIELRSSCVDVRVAGDAILELVVWVMRRGLPPGSDRLGGLLVTPITVTLASVQSALNVHRAHNGHYSCAPQYTVFSFSRGGGAATGEGRCAHVWLMPGYRISHACEPWTIERVRENVASRRPDAATPPRASRSVPETRLTQGVCH